MKVDVSVGFSEDIFRESILPCFLKISIALKKTCAIVCSEIPFSKKLYDIETKIDCFVKLFDFNVIRFFTESCFRTDFSYTVIKVFTATVINCKIILYLNYQYKPRVLTKGLTSWNTKMLLRNLLYRQKEKIKIPKYYKDFYHEIFFSVISQKIYSAKLSYCQN